jgi:hypothetical protein
MPTTEPTLTLVEYEGGYLLRRVSAKGQISKMLLSEQDVLNLGQSLPSLRDRILSRYSRAGTIVPIVTTPVAHFSLNHDLLGEDIVLTLTVPSGSEIAYSIPLDLAARLAERIPDHVVRARGRKNARQ